MAKRASEQAGVKRRVIGVSRFGADGLEATLTSTRMWKPFAVTCSIPTALSPPAGRAQHRLYGGNEVRRERTMKPLTWAMNSYLPGMVCQKFRHSRIVAFSTGNVYGLTPLHRGGSVETDACAPLAITP